MKTSDLTKKYHPIDCGLYDQLELVCVRRNEITVELADGRQQTGVAQTIDIIKDDGEYLVLQVDASQHRVRIDSIVRLHTPESVFEFSNPQP